MKLLRVIRKYSRYLFGIYMFILIAVIVMKFPTGLVVGTIQKWKAGEDVVRMSPQLLPLKTIVDYVKNVQSVHDWFFKNLACNIVMFIPYGFLAPMLKRGSTPPMTCVIVSGILLSCFIEIFQYVTALGLCDIDDVILNTVGVLLGVIVYKILYRRKIT